MSKNDRPPSDVKLTGVERVAAPLPMPDYEVIESPDSFTLKQNMRAWMADGWLPQGGPILRQADGMWFQAMVKSVRRSS